MDEHQMDALQRRLCDDQADVVFYPVRHHSPASADLLSQLIEELKPGAVLIEGPSDFNDSINELSLEHELPIAIYSYFQLVENQSQTATHHGVYYPFCEYSPEWVAIQAARSCGAAIRFIDLPWAESFEHERTTHRYADAELRRGRYVQALCERLQVEDFDDLWDRLIESQLGLSRRDYLHRVHSLCLNIRVWEQPISLSDRQREAFMAAEIRASQARFEGPLVVVTGGFHSGALAARLSGLDCLGSTDDAQENGARRIAQRGIALTTYSYQRLDNLTGYDAGMPSPGFYEYAWRQRRDRRTFDHQPLLSRLVDALRGRKQTLSTADLIAVETSAQAIAALRGRRHVWRRDLLDAVTSCLIKDELEYGCASPFIDAVHEVLRGERRGRLAQGTRLPPLVRDIQDQLETFGLRPDQRGRQIELDLTDPEGQRQSRLLHRLRILEIRGFSRRGGTDFSQRDNLDRLWELWQLRWSPEFEASCIEASRYGTRLSTAAAACLTQQAAQTERDATAAAELLILAAQAGVETLSQSLLESLERLIHSEPRFVGATSCLEHLLFLYCFDEALGTQRLEALRTLVRETFSRSLALCESHGRPVSDPRSLLRGMRTMRETFRRLPDVLDWTAEEIGDVIRRVQSDAHKPPLLRGAAAGMLWSLGQATTESVLEDLLFFSDPEQLGDFLAGLFAVAREQVQRQPELLRAIDQLLLDFAADDFQAALPSLRLAFTSFTPREKHHMLSTLFQSLQPHLKPSAALATADAETVQEAVAIEERLFEAVKRYGLERQR